MSSFAQPYAFLLFAPLLLAAWHVYRRRVRHGLLFAPLARMPARPRMGAAALRLLCPALFLAGIAFGIVALARPRTVTERIRRQTDAVAIQMVVDCSGSMEALDFSTRDTYRSRLDAVKQTFTDFVNRRPDDLIGLITFGGYATTRVPLTLDHKALLQTLKAVEVPKNVFNADGQVVNAEETLTAIGDGLATAAARLEKADVKSKLCVLLTDGESNTGAVKPEQAMKAAKALGIRVYTIGVGSNGQAPIMVRDMFGRNVIQYAEVRIDEDTLRTIAKTTGGQYFNVRNPDGLQKALADIDKLEKTRVRRDVFDQYDEKYPLPLAAGILLLVLGAFGNVFLTKGVV